MQVKLIENASSKFSEIENLQRAGEMKDLETFEFLKKNEWWLVYYHHKIRPDWLCEISEYEKTRKYEIPLELIILEDKTTDSNTESISFYKKHDKLINFWAILAIIIILVITYSLREKPKPIKSILDINAEAQKKNIDIRTEKLEQQKIIKRQIKNLREKLEKNIQEVQEIDLKNSLLREQSILQTN